MTYRIRSLDGGGTWALLEALALGDLYPGQSGHQILAHFDLAVANSGGSIVLGGLMLDMTPAQIATFFEDQTKRESIFHKKPFFEEALSVIPIFARYIAAQKRVGLGGVFGAPGNITMADWRKQAGWPNGPSGAPVGALIMAFDYDHAREEFIRSYDIPATGAKAETVALVDAVHASSNAPVTFFDAPAIVGSKRYWDGAMGGYNNPLMAGVVDAIALGADPSDIICLTIGTGTVRLATADALHSATSQTLVAQASNPSTLGDLAKAAGCITDDPPDAASYTAHIVLGNPAGMAGRVVRLNAVVQPLLNAAGKWDYPPGLPQAVFDPLSKLSMDAVEAADVALIQKLGAAWLADTAPNQPIRMRDDLTCALGHSRYSAAKAQWMAISTP